MYDVPTMPSVTGKGDLVVGKRCRRRGHTLLLSGYKARMMIPNGRSVIQCPLILTVEMYLGW